MSRNALSRDAIFIFPSQRIPDVPVDQDFTLDFLIPVLLSIKFKIPTPFSGRCDFVTIRESDTCS